MELDLDRLSKILGLLGSSHDGERAAAARKATEALKRAGLTWAEFTDLIRRHRREEDDEDRLSRWASTYRRTRREQLDHRDAAELCLERDHLLTDWEEGFCNSLVRFAYLSERQEAVLARLCRKCGVEWP